MKPSVVCAAALALGACSQPDTRLRGTLAESAGSEPLFVWVADGSHSARALVDTFSFSRIAPGTVDLRIGAGREEIARMEIRDLPAGAELSLERVRLDRRRDRAIPSAIRLAGAEWVTINGIRMADPARLPSLLDAAGVVLAISGREDALLLRPEDGGLPDLPIVVTPATVVVDDEGGEASLERVSKGDRLRVEGRTTSGYLYADRVTLTRSPDEAAARPERAGDEREEDGRGRRIPDGHRPPPGECRDWIPGLPAGQQPPPRKC
ncbi:MAG: hypothetical protein ICV87_10775 [Gemmatimonadetes bacterium]|nr:hypothetical protein [Gemmatimonadota bacterium]